MNRIKTLNKGIHVFGVSHCACVVTGVSFSDVIKAYTVLSIHNFNLLLFFTIDATVSYIKDISSIFIDLFQVDIPSRLKNICRKKKYGQHVNYCLKVPF